MCISNNNSPIIRVGEKTNKAKYEFLRLYYTIWNQITKVRPRIIIDTHAGSGIVELIGERNILNKKNIKKIYGSALLAILKTLKISKRLSIILNEKDPARYFELKRYVDDFRENGIFVFKKKVDNFFYISFKTKRKRKLRQKKEWHFPESPDEKPHRGYFKARAFTNAKIITYNNKIEDIIDEIFLKYLEPIDEGDKILKPIALFLVDPCGVVGWKDLIEKICKRSIKEEGTELILNWSWEAINRNLPTYNKTSVLSKLFGIPIENIEGEFKVITEMEQFLKKYKSQLLEYFKYVVEIGVPRDRKIKPKQSRHKKYFLLFCTNNESALSLACNKAKKINKSMRGNFENLNSFINS